MFVEKMENNSLLSNRPVYNIYTDGGCRTDIGLGGWSYVIVHKKEIIKEDSGLVEQTTNNIMELTGVIKGMESFIRNFPKLVKSAHVNVICDSTYAISGIKHRWIEKWKSNGWHKFGTNHPVKNRELWETIDDLNNIFNSIQWYWVRGHNGNKFNEKVDSNIQKLFKQYVKNNNITKNEELKIN